VNKSRVQTVFTATDSVPRKKALMRGIRATVKKKVLWRVAPVVFVALSGVALTACGSNASSGGSGAHHSTTTTPSGGGAAY
jgi:hypothetical protein